MTATIVNPQYDRGVAALVTPPPYGYLLLAATVAPPKGPPIVRRSAARRSVLQHLEEGLISVARLAGVTRATGYRAVLIPPARPPAFRPDLKPPRFDVTVLVETESPDALPEVAEAPAVAVLRALLHDSASVLKEMHATCVKAIADVEKRPAGIYLFNFWAAADRATAYEVFDHLATWFQANTALANSTVLQAIGDDDFAFVNHAAGHRSALHSGPPVPAAQLLPLRPAHADRQPHRGLSIPVPPSVKGNPMAIYPDLAGKVALMTGGSRGLRQGGRPAGRSRELPRTIDRGQRTDGGRNPGGPATSDGGHVSAGPPRRARRRRPGDPLSRVRRVVVDHRRHARHRRRTANVMT
jgi:hypothetical protein